ncbi:MAG: small multi-drug export protein [Firmicutes bacterium]|nr:small multi-drug export protein [Bacillota bacterium]
MQDTLIQWFQNTLGGLVSNEVIVFIISMVPILELRGGLIAARLMQIPYVKAAILCAIGNLVPIPFILWFITPVFAWLKKTKLFRPLVEKLENRAMGKADKIEKAEFWGLVLFVGIPLPGTGAWTGGLIASMLGIKFKKAFPAMCLGVFLALTLMSIITYVIPYIVSLF